MTFDYKNLIVFEMANNHEGDLKHGLRIIEEMARIKQRYNIRAAVKLQYRDLETIIHPDYRDRKDVKHIPRFLATSLKREELYTLIMATHDNGMISIVTPFDERSVDIALNHGVDILKIASCSCQDWPLLESICKADKPIICSTGGCKISDIDKIVTFFEHRKVSNLALLHCIGIYPTENKDQQLQFMRRMMERYPHLAIGYSGHEAPDNFSVAPAAVAMGAQIMERHVGLPAENIKLNAYSMNPEQAARWVEVIVAARELCGNNVPDKHVSETEAVSLRSLMRGVYAKSLIKKGEIITRDNIFFAMPCQPGQTSSRQYIDTMEASKDYQVNEPITEVRRYNPINVMRSVVHEAKGLLREARIPIGKDYFIELSHHYGLDSFRRFGAVIVNVVNREYCKKIIILLPGQYHPSHAHQRKEETFQVLYGDMELELEGEKYNMRPGDIQLVRRGEHHAFSTKNGVIFEEISTTHLKNDSIYADEQISKLDPAERKNIIEEW